MSEKEFEEKGIRRLPFLFICTPVYAIMFYIVCYWMVPHTEKALFFAVLCLGGFAIPFIPAVLYEKKVNKYICRLVTLIFIVPIVLGIIFVFKYIKLSQHNYILPNSDKILFKATADWEMLENDGVGDKWSHWLYIDCTPGESGSYHVASLNTDIKINASVSEDDSYDDEEELELDYNDSSHNTIIFPAAINFGKQQTATTEITVRPDHSRRQSNPSEYGQARWRCKITVKRKFEFWEVLFADLDYTHVDYTAPYQMETPSKDPQSYDDGSVQHFSADSKDIEHYLYDFDMIQLRSSAIYEVGYSEDEECLLIRFEDEDGSLYVYYDVPGTVFYELLNAEQPGSYFNNSIRDHYEYISIY